MIKLSIFSLIVGGALSFCVYFDHKRRSDTNFRKKLNERRKIKTHTKIAENDSYSKFPEIFLKTSDLQKPKSTTGFDSKGDPQIDEILKKIQIYVENIAIEVYLSKDPEALLSELKQILLPSVFQIIIFREQQLRQPNFRY